ncbi:RepB family plasmid replication initiator protein [Lactococcus lactis]|uniref:Replication protein n=1 Tax=Lactococcus lactis subsp. lactis TaxID=1360 RepID=A0A0V8DWB4_LACLL|nr:RepB family plasmid replication initiator protein [Lactococcus lactis]KSU17658.1 Replication protein [Lactococcus lactis subsp. lactis]
MTIITEKEKSFNTEELQLRKVAEHNDLISSVAKMDKTPLKIFELAVSCIDTDNPPEDNTVYLSKRELFSFFDVSDSNKHSRFKEAIERMQKQAFFQIKEEKKKGFKFKSIVPIPYIEWNDYNDNVRIEFSQHIMPYLIDLKTNFTQYAISDIMGLNQLYSIILYKWLCMSYNQFEHYQHKPNRTQKQLEEYKNPKISVKDLRALTDTEDIYTRMFHFTEWVLDNPIKEINENTHFNVTYDKIKKGRSIDSIQFHIVKKANWKDENYKRNDVQAQLTEEQKQVQNQVNYAVAVASPYTVKLLNVPLIYAIEITNQETMIGLNEHVYPIYDNLVKELGSDALDAHLSYVKNKMVDYSAEKKNIVKYLSVAATQYLSSRLSVKQMKKGG